jgi:hypothetical protein
VLALATLVVALLVASVVVAGAIGSAGLELLAGSVLVAGITLSVVAVAVDLRRQHDKSGPGQASGRLHGAGV